MTKIIIEQRYKLPIGYTNWTPILKINYQTLKKITHHTFTPNMRIRLE